MVAAAIGISGALGAGANLFGSMTASNASAASAKAQQQQLNQLLARQSDILQGAIPMATDLQNRNLDALYGGQVNALSGVSNALGYGADVLGRYLPSTIQAIQAGADRGLGYLTDAAGNIRNLLSPYVTAGANAADELWGEISGTRGVPGQAGSLGAMPNLTDPSLLPGYAFALQQGELAAKNQASATGIAGMGGDFSGPLGKSLATFAKGLADSSYSQYLQNYWANQNNRYGILSGLMGTGGQVGSDLGSILASIAGNQGNIATTAGANIGGAYSHVADALASLYQHSGDALSNIYTGTAQNVMTGLTDPMRILAGIATGTGNQSATTGSAIVPQIGNALQATGSTLGAGITSAGNALSGSFTPLLSNYLTGSTIASVQPAGYSGLTNAQANAVNQQGFYFSNGNPLTGQTNFLGF